MSTPITLAPGYYWGPKLTRPSKLDLTSVASWAFYALPAGIHDIVTIPVGDNFKLADENLCKYKTINLAKPSHISVMPVYDVDEPSCGFLICRRGPYTEGTPENQRGNWKINTAPSGMNFGRTVAPIYTHSGARHGRYSWNGYAWAGEGFFPSLTSSYWGTTRTPVGPKKFGVAQRAPIVPAKYAPDVTLTSRIDAGTYFISFTKVDMFGRETQPSEPLQVVVQADNSHVVVRRNGDTEMGTSGFYIYIGKSIDNMHRQPILNAEGVTPQYLWPVSHQHFTIHSFQETGIRAVEPPSYGVASIINQPQKDVVDGKLYINYGRDSYDLYCPFLLPYSVPHFGRKLGLDGKRCTFYHRTKYGNARLMSNIPLVVISNQKDEIANAKFVSHDDAICGVTFNDYSGGQAFSPAITKCSFELYGPEGIGFLVEDAASIWDGNHTASEVRVKGTLFIATIPVKIEGNQSAKIRFTDMCTFWAICNTKYKADTVGCVYACCPNDIDFENVEGIGGTFRSIICLAGYSGPASVALNNLFVDMGCPVYATFASYNGGKVTIEDGERINSHSQGWARMAEAPAALRAYMRMKDIHMSPNTTSICFNLNQIALDLDVPVDEVVTPTQEWWLALGLALENNVPGSSTYFDYRVKQTRNYSFGQSNVPDNLTQNSNPIAVIGSKEPVVNEPKKTKPDHWASNLSMVTYQKKMTMVPKVAKE